MGFLHIVSCLRLEKKLTLNRNLFFSVFERDGTTDVTRTMHFGTPTAYEKVRRQNLKRDSRGPLWFLKKSLAFLERDCVNE